MSASSFKLYRLQQVDSQLDEARERLHEIDEILADNQAMQAAKAKLRTAEQQHDEADKDLRAAEGEVQDQQFKIENNQSRLYSGSVTNPKELQDLQQEAEALKRHLATLEDVQLEKMLAAEETEAAMKEAQAKLDQVRAEQAQEHGELGAEQQELMEDVDRLENEREAASRGIDDDSMRIYQKLRKDKGGIAVAKVKDKTCTACGTTLAQSLAQAARSQTELSTCSTCKRILYAG